MIATGNSHDAIISESKPVEQADNQHEQIMQIPVAELHPFEGHPFRVTDDEDMLRMAESMTQYRVISPLLARPDTDGGYEIISDHRRRRAAELAGLETLPVVIREMNDDEAIIAMADTNLQRETILPSERAWAYKMKLDAIKHQGARTDITSGQVGHKLAHGTKSIFTVAEDAGVSKSQVQRYIRLTNLIPELMKMVDEKKITFNPAVELSYLTGEEQADFIKAMEYAQTTPSLSQAQRLKKQSQAGGCTLEVMREILSEDKKKPLDRIVFDTASLRKYFPASYSSRQMEDTIIKLLEQWQRKRQRGQER